MNISDIHFGTKNINYDHTINLNNDKDSLSQPSSCYYDNISNKFIWLDALFSYTALLNTKGYVEKILTVSPKEFEKYCSNAVPKSIFNFLKLNNILNVIYLNFIDFKSKSVSIIASLPKVDLDINKKDTTVNYNNQIAIINKQIDIPDVSISEIEIPKILQDKGYFTKHVQIKLLSNRNYLLPLYKGWPIIGTSEFDSTNYSLSYNPFLDSFYNQTELLVFFNKATNNYKAFGELSSFSKKNKIGYYLYNPVLAEFENKIYFNDGLTDTIAIYDLNSLTLINKINLNFTGIADIENKNFKKIKNKKYALNYFLDIDNIDRTFINKLEILNDSILFYTTFSTGAKNVYLNKYNLKNKQLEKYFISKYNNNKSDFYINLYKSNQKIQLLVFSEEGDIKKISVKNLND